MKRNVLSALVTLLLIGLTACIGTTGNTSNRQTTTPTPTLDYQVQFDTTMYTLPASVGGKIQTFTLEATVRGEVRNGGGGFACYTQEVERGTEVSITWFDRIESDTTTIFKETLSFQTSGTPAGTLHVTCWHMFDPSKKKVIAMKT